MKARMHEVSGSASKALPRSHRCWAANTASALPISASRIPAQLPKPAQAAAPRLHERQIKMPHRFLMHFFRQTRATFWPNVMKWSDSVELQSSKG
jgi:hypothetical protein